ncbi:MAG TPA: AraC family transcriptional regulator [Steroidobacteraceae bacterium]|jgi:AraC-like DNA-binding protein
MDVLSNVLQVANLATQGLGSREFLAPWGIKAENPGRATVHVVRRGSCWFSCRSSEPVRLNAGDVVLLAHGDAHAFSSERDMRNPEPLSLAIARTQGNVVPSRGMVDPAAESTILQCAGYELSRDTSHPLLALLPPVIRIPADQADSDSELQLLLRLLMQEAARRDAGVELVLPRLIDTLFVYVLRVWLRDQPDGAGGWLGALRDPQIRKVLARIHESPQTPWTVESLAGVAAMSRAAFAKRFADMVGEPPLAYVTRWRMDIAAKMLRESRDPVARIAGRVGYVSETAFAKAFRRRRNIAPGAYRYQRTASPVLG